MNAVLITVHNGEKVIDAGTGFVIGQANAKSYVLTCAHTLKALGRQTTDSKLRADKVVDGNTVRIVVAGKNATTNEDKKLKDLDLAVLTVEGVVGPPLTLALESSDSSDAKVTCEGFTFFFRGQFAQRTVSGHIKATTRVVTPECDELSYLEIKPTAKSGDFAKGLSGAPILDKVGKVIGIARILDGTTQSEVVGADGPKPKAAGYALKLTLPILKLIREKIPTNGASTAVPWETLLQDPALAGKAATHSERDWPANPKPQTVANDIQKNRWGGKATDFGRTVTVENVREGKHSFIFDAVVTSTDQSPLVGPVVFHLHDTFAKSVIWIRKITGQRAVLATVESFGTFTIGVQCKDRDGYWRSLEFDLEEYEGGVLRKYD